MNNVDTIISDLILAKSHIRLLKASGHLAIVIARQACDDDDEAKLNILEENFNIDFPFMSHDE